MSDLTPKTVGYDLFKSRLLELERLRNIEKAARELVENYDSPSEVSIHDWITLKDALAQPPEGV